MTIRLVVLDLDGTLLDPDHRISAANAAAVAACRANGVRVVLATGRMVVSAAPYANALGLDTPLITLNGATLARAGQAQVTVRNCLAPVDLALVLDTLAERAIPYVIFGPDAIYAEPQIARHHIELLESYGDPPAQRYDRAALRDLPEPIKVLTFLEPGGYDRELNGLLAQRVEVVRSGAPFLEFLPLGVSKGAAVAELMQQWDLARDEVLVIGDGENDLSMFAVAGISVAMQDAPNVVHAAATHRTGSSGNNGVATALRRFVLGGL
ncbi:MAG: HAD family phosphatase [Oscillochloris sp.]|nr:HAD family phosphatase [Oscillochloris sp.]